MCHAMVKHCSTARTGWIGSDLAPPGSRGANPPLGGFQVLDGSGIPLIHDVLVLVAQPHDVELRSKKVAALQRALIEPSIM